MLKVMFKVFSLTLVSSALLLAGCQHIDTTTTKSAVTEVVSSPKLKLRSDMVTGQLDNGLNYIVVNNNKPADKVSLQLVVHAGSLVEDDDQKGIAHLVEHMAFNGTELYPSNKIIDRQQELGMTFGRDVNAMTEYYATSYFLHLPSNELAMLNEGFTMLSQQVSALTFVQDELVKERPVVEEEWRRKLGLRSRIGRAGREALMAGSRFVEREPIGDMELIRHLHASRIEAFWNDWYHPNNMTMIIVGDVEEADAKQMLEKHFAKLEKKDLPKRPDLSIPLNQSPKITVIADEEITRTSISVNLREHQPSSYTEAEVRQGVIQALAMRMFNKRMAEQYQFPSTQFARISGAEQPLGLDYLNTRFSGVLRTEDTQAGLKEIFNELSRYAEHGFAASDLEFEKKRLKKAYSTSLKRLDKNDNRSLLSAISSKVRRQEPVLDTKAYLKLIINLLDGIKLHEVNANFAQTVKARQPLVIVQTSKQNEAKQPTSEQVEQLWLQSLKQAPAEIAAVTFNGQLLKSEPKAAEVVEHNVIKDIHHWRLENGVDVWFQPNSEVKGKLNINWQGKGGIANLPEELKRAAQMMSGYMPAFGYGGYSALELKNINNGEQIRLPIGLGADSHFIASSVRTESYETWLQNLHLLLTQPQVDDKVWLSKRNLRIQQLDKQKKTPEQEFYQKLGKLEFPHSTLNKPLIAQELAEIDSSQLMMAWKQLFSSADKHQLVVFGDAKPEDVIKQAQKYVGSLSKGKSLAEPELSKPFTGEHKLVMNKGNQPSAKTVVLQSEKMMYSPERKVHGQLLKRIVSQRLRLKLREEAAGVYTTSFSVNFSERQNLVKSSLSYSHQPHRAEELRAMAQAIFDDIAANGVTKSELSQARHLSLKALDPENIKPRVKYSWLTNMAEKGQYQDKAQQVINNYNKAEISDINLLAKKLFSSKNRIEGLLLPEKQ